MASLVVDRGLQVIGGRASSTSDSFAAIQSMSVDDSSSAFVAGDTSLGLSSTDSFVVNNFDSTPSRTNETVSHIATFGTSEANFTIRRIALHNVTEGNVGETTDTLIAGTDGQSLQKTSDFSMTITLDLSYSDNS